MSKQIIWTIKAQTEIIAIFQYWNERTGSYRFSERLNKLIEEELRLLSKFPSIGRITDVSNVWVKIIQEYLLYYEFNEENIYVLTIRHQKRNPNTRSLK